MAWKWSVLMAVMIGIDPHKGSHTAVVIGPSEEPLGRQRVRACPDQAQQLLALGPGLIWAYGPEAAAIAVGTTGGGPDIPGSPQMPSLNWQELAGDLRLARHFCDQILIHSLEGCVWQGFLPRLRSFEWEDADRPPDGARAAAALRKTLRATLWASAHPWRVLGITAAAAWLAWRWRRE
jgi:hypothetical protein